MKPLEHGQDDERASPGQAGLQLNSTVEASTCSPQSQPDRHGVSTDSVACRTSGSKCCLTADTGRRHGPWMAIQGIKVPVGRFTAF